MNQAENLIAQAEALQERFEQALEASGLNMKQLRELADQIRRKLPPTELRRVEDAERVLLHQERHRPGTSGRTLPIGIRG